MSAYLDSNIVIYLVEQPAGFGRRASARVSALVAAGEPLVVSDLTRLECRIGPIGTGDLATLSQYDEFFRRVGRPCGPANRNCVRQGNRDSRETSSENGGRPAFGRGDRGRM